MLTGERLQQLRQDKNLSQGHIQKSTGLLRCYVSRVENGHTVPSIETFEKFARRNISRMGFHAFRRYRATFLDSIGTPESLTRFWLGHSGKSVTEKYVKLFGETEYRRSIAEKVGVGFQLESTVSKAAEISSVRNLRRISDALQNEIAA
jgi:integrase